jgi:hypothetical protein
MNKEFLKGYMKKGMQALRRQPRISHQEALAQAKAQMGWKKPAKSNKPEK